MSEIRITNFVDPEAIEKVKELNAECQNLVVSYTGCVRELAKGLEVNVKGIGDLDQLEKLLVDKVKEATEVNTRFNKVIEQQGAVIANTTPTISRQLMMQERVNKTQREAYTESEKVKKLLEHYYDSYENQTKALFNLQEALKANKKAQDDNKKALEAGRITSQQYADAQVELIAEHRALTQEKRTLNQAMTAEEKMAQSTETGYKHMSQQLELLKKAYKDLSAEALGTDYGKELEEAIQNLDAHLKDMAADQGEFQRNVGNYAIAAQNGVLVTESLTSVLEKEARTQQDLVDQTKILEEAKRLLDTNDEHYIETLEKIDGKLAENKKRLTDVADIIDKQAGSIAEAEAQNKRLQEALKHVDLSGEGAQQTIAKLNAKIAENKKLIEENTPAIENEARALREQTKAMQEQIKAMQEQKEASENLADTLLGMVGINTRLGSSFETLGDSGNFIEGINTKAKAFGKTLLGILSNPWVLTFLGITGVVAGFKWWYDYNKGLIEASRLTQNFTGLTGDAADKVTADCQAMAESMGKSFDETIGAANTLVQQFGLTWEEALQRIQDGIVAGADMNGNLTANINQFAGAFHDAGIEADQFIAILSETRNGIFDEKGLKSITDAGSRLRAMTKSTEAALEGVGISAKKMQDDLANGNITMLEAVQQVTDKLNELPPNCQEVGTVMKDVFGRKSAQAGEELLKSISSINDNLDIAKANMGELGRVNEEQLNTQKELNETLAAVFKMGGTRFEEMTTQAKTFMAQGLLKIIRGCVDVSNWVIRIYNNSVLVREGIERGIFVLKTLWSVVKNVCGAIADEFKGIGQMLEGVFTLDVDLINKGYTIVVRGIGDAVKGIADDIVDSVKTAEDRIANGHLDEIDIKLNVEPEEKAAKSRAPGYSPSGAGDESEEDRKKRAKAEKEAEKLAREELKRINELEESKLALMADGHEKELAQIRLKFKKKMDEITGDGETEKALRIQLAEQCEKEVSDAEARYQAAIANTNLELRLASVEKGSEDERRLKLAKLARQQADEIKEAERSGADILLIEEKYNRLRIDLEAEYAANRAGKLQEEYAVEEIIRNEAYSKAVNDIKARYAKELEAAGNNAAMREAVERKLDQELYELDTSFSRQTAEATIRMLEETLALEELSAEDRKKWEAEVAKAKISLADQIADANAESVRRQIEDDNRLRDARIKNIDTWKQMTTEAISNMASLADALFEGRVSRIEEEEEANTAAGEKEVTRITELVNKQVITQEEGEARKRAAEAKTAKKTEELEKKKAQIKHRQAVFDKAVSIANIGIDTAEALIKLWVSPGWPAAIPMSAFVSAMGALQLATVLATPIPKYAKGTDYHSGGPAIVGDGGRHEVIIYNNLAWLTPDKPTLVTMPEGAVVRPDAKELFPGNTLAELSVSNQSPIMKQRLYDDARVREGISELARLLRLQMRIQRESANNSRYEFFKSRI